MTGEQWRRGNNCGKKLLPIIHYEKLSVEIKIELMILKDKKSQFQAVVAHLEMHA